MSDLLDTPVRSTIDDFADIDPWLRSAQQISRFKELMAEEGVMRTIEQALAPNVDKPSSQFAFVVALLDQLHRSEGYLQACYETANSESSPDGQRDTDFLCAWLQAVLFNEETDGALTKIDELCQSCEDEVSRQEIYRKRLARAYNEACHACVGEQLIRQQAEPFERLCSRDLSAEIARLERKPTDRWQLATLLGRAMKLYVPDDPDSLRNLLARQTLFAAELAGSLYPLALSSYLADQWKRDEERRDPFWKPILTLAEDRYRKYIPHTLQNGQV